MSLTDARKMWTLLRDAGETGCHSHDLRRQGITGNPSQRAKDIASKGVAIWTAREPRNGRPGSRWWLAEHAPDWAVPVRPNGVEGGSGATESHPLVRRDRAAAAPLNIAPAPQDTTEPVAIVRDWDGAWKELPARDFQWPEAA